MKSAFREEAHRGFFTKEYRHNNALHVSAADLDKLREVEKVGKNMTTLYLSAFKLLFNYCFTKV